VVSLVGLEVFEGRDLARGPGDLQLIDLGGLAKAEGQWKLDGREVALGGEELATTDRRAELYCERVCLRHFFFPGTQVTV